MTLTRVEVDDQIQDVIFSVTGPLLIAALHVWMQSEQNRHGWGIEPTTYVFVS